jgi:hypothetical protein
MSVLNMLNTKYIIGRGKEGEPPQPQYNPGACGAAWFVNDYKIVADADEEIKSLDKFEPKQIAFIDKRFESTLNNFKPTFDSTASIKLTEYISNHLTYQSQSVTEQLAIFSEIYYDKGWNVYVDGLRSDYLRANYVLRAMKVPAGNHKIEWKFEPTIYSTGEKISMAGSLVLLLFFGAGAYFEVKKK